MEEIEKIREQAVSIGGKALDGNETMESLREAAQRFPDTDVWMDTCGEKELRYAIQRGSVGATSNPIIIGQVIQEELPYWEPIIQKLVKDNPGYTEDELTWMLIDEVGRQRSQLLLPVFQRFKGKKGRLSIQTNAKYFCDASKMARHALHLSDLAPNMQVKMPASQAGLEAIEEVTYRGVSVNATISFTVAQAVAVAQAVERGLSRRKAEHLPCEEMAPVCTIMVGRTDDWLKKQAAQLGLAVAPECLEWAGVAVFKEAYRIYQERGYTTRLLSAANRNIYHWSELVGGDLCQTINYDWHKRLNASGIQPQNRIGEQIPSKWIEELQKLPDFARSFSEEGMSPVEFQHYGAFHDTLATFLEGYDKLVRLVRGYQI